MEEGIESHEGSLRPVAVAHSVIEVDTLYNKGKPMRLTRRDFLKASGAVAATVAFGGGALSGRAEASGDGTQAQSAEAMTSGANLLDLQGKELETQIRNLEILAEFPVPISTWVQLCSARVKLEEGEYKSDLLTTGSNSKTREQVETELTRSIELAEDGARVKLDTSRFGESIALAVDEDVQSKCLVPPEEIARLLDEAFGLGTLAGREENVETQELLARLDIPKTRKLVEISKSDPAVRGYLKRELRKPRGIFYQTRTSPGEREYVRQALAEPEATQKPEERVISFQIFAGESPRVDNRGNTISTMTAIVGRMRPETVYNGIVSTDLATEQVKEVKRAPAGVEFYNATPINLPNRPEGEKAFVVEVDNASGGVVEDEAGVSFQRGTSTWLFTKREENGEIVEEWIRLDSDNKDRPTGLRPAKAYVVEGEEDEKPVVLLESDSGVQAIFIGSREDRIDPERVILGKVEEWTLPVGEIKGEYINAEDGERKLIIYRAFGEQRGVQYKDRTFDLQRAEVNFTNDGKIGEVNELQSILKRPMQAAEPIGIKISKTDGEIKLVAEIDRYDGDPMLVLLQDNGKRILAGVVVSPESTIQGELRDDYLLTVETAGLRSEIDGPYGAARIGLYRFPF